MADQPQGSYPRVNGKMIKSGDFNGQMISIVGKFGAAQPGGGTVEFVTCDSSTIALSTEYAPVPEALPEASYYEVIGQMTDDQNQPVMMFVVRELSSDMDMDVYNQMIQVQHNPKYQAYFAPVAAS